MKFICHQIFSKFDDQTNHCSKWGYIYFCSKDKENKHQRSGKCPYENIHQFKNFLGNASPWSGNKFDPILPDCRNVLCPLTGIVYTSKKNLWSNTLGAFPHTKKARFESRFKSRLFLRVSTQAEKSAIWIATIFLRVSPHRQKNRDPNRTGSSELCMCIVCKQTTHADSGAPALHDGI